MLYIIGTPIGNLRDITYRAVETLRSVEVLLAEDTNAARTLLDTYIISHPKIIAYHKDNEFGLLPEVVEMVEYGKVVGLISQAGMPGVSDPGALLLQHIIRRELPYVIVPGVSAVTTALLHSPLPVSRFMFVGFLPKKESELKKQIEQCRQITKIDKEAVFIAFESPHRIAETIPLLTDFDVTICRELTKVHEEIIRDVSGLEEEKWRGEITLLLRSNAK